MRRAVDVLFGISAGLAGLFLVGVLVMIMTGILTRAIGVYIPGTTAYASYCMAASGFLALGPTLRRGGHIRVEMLLQKLSPTRRLAWERACGLVGFAIAGFLAYSAVRLCWQSYLFNAVSQGADATPLWIPQIGMAVGCVSLMIAFLELCLDPALSVETSVATDGGVPVVID